MNIYRGCTHGCIYCDARSTCYQINHLFEDIEVKENALELLEAKLKSKRNKCMIGTGGMTDPYMPLEKNIMYTRKALELIYKYDFGIAIQTKSDLILRDLDILEAINRRTKTVVQVTLTTYDDSLCRIIEPKVTVTSGRANILKECQKRGIPTVVWLTPLLPWINDTTENVEGLMRYCKEFSVKGIITFGLGLTLRDGDRQYFYKALDRHFPGLRANYIEKYGNNYEIPLENADELMEIVRRDSISAGIMYDSKEVFAYLHSYENKAEQQQMNFFDFLK